jgi:uncharacterized membrane protein YqjE
LISSAHERIELFSVELQEEKYRFIQLLVWIGATIFAAAMALTFGSLVLVYLFWDGARLAVLTGLTGFYVLAFAVIVAAFRRYLARQPKPFAATLEEIQEDGECIRNPN